MNYAQIRKFDVTNGPDIRTTLFVSGCTHNCPGCFNEEQQDFNYGNEFTKEKEDEFIKYASNPNIKGISILGGEPFNQDLSIMFKLLFRLYSEVKKPVWVWTGFTYEEIIKDRDKVILIPFIDVLIDGRFEIDKKDLNLKYRGSSNQRVINVQESLINNKIILYNY